MRIVRRGRVLGLRTCCREDNTRDVRVVPEHRSYHLINSAGVIAGEISRDGKVPVTRLERKATQMWEELEHAGERIAGLDAEGDRLLWVSGYQQLPRPALHSRFPQRII